VVVVVFPVEVFVFLVGVVVVVVSCFLIGVVVVVETFLVTVGSGLIIGSGVGKVVFVSSIIVVVVSVFVVLFRRRLSG
tara:strand:- start:3 stop:236 length:234 start_codon:yes stop_codon:yes gene_type:complete